MSGYELDTIDPHVWAEAFLPQPPGDVERSSYAAAVFRSIGYTQGGAADNTNVSKVADLTDMLTLYDAMGLPGTGTTPLKFYLGLPAAITTATAGSQSNYGTVEFCRTNAPGQGGPYSGRVFFSSSSHPWLFNGADNIHTGDYGTARWGEWEGYVRHLVQDLSMAWTPLWRPLTGGAITRSGQTFTVPFARPAGPDFAAGVLTWATNRDDGVKAYPQNGFHVYRGATDLPLTATINGLAVDLTVTPALVSGETLEVSYCWHGPGGPDPGTDPGVGGNLVMTGPPSVLFPNGYNSTAKTLDAWAVPFFENVVV